MVRRSAWLNPKRCASTSAPASVRSRRGRSSTHQRHLHQTLLERKRRPVNFKFLKPRHAHLHNFGRIIEQWDCQTAGPSDCKFVQKKFSSICFVRIGYSSCFKRVNVRYWNTFSAISTRLNNVSSCSAPRRASQRHLNPR
jgi:hypothetical protein